MTEQNFDQMRKAMVASQLRTTGVSDARVVQAMAALPREDFVPADKAALAYLDIALPIAPGRWLNPPMVTGRLLTEAQVQPGDRALLVGAATGYSAALLVSLGAHVVALDSDEALQALAKAAPVPSAEWVLGPLAEGHAAGAPYSLIMIDGAVEQIPAALVEQLADGGRLVAALIENGVSRLVTGVRVGAGFGTRSFADADAAPLPGFAKPAAFSF